MKFYMAPMEGITGYVYRTAYHKHFHNIDKYFTPFLASRKLGQREIYEILPEHNEGMYVIPQILANKADVFCDIAKTLKEYGYDTVNLNLGCPSGTVAAKGRGAGFLAFPDELDCFLYDIYENSPVKISIKTRIGIDTPDEWETLLRIYEKYPLEELIIHPRLQQDFYNHTPNRDAFIAAMRGSRNLLCYNGDIYTNEDYEQLLHYIEAEIPGAQLPSVMLGRGILKNPGLVEELRMRDCKSKPGEPVTRERMRAFHDDILHGYLEVLPGEKPVLFKMKELWSYLAEWFERPEKPLKKIRKAGHLTDYESAVDELFRC